MKTLKLLSIIPALAILVACSSQPEQSRINYEQTADTLFNHLPADADRSQPERQLDLMSRGLYVTTGGEVIPIPRAVVENDGQSELFMPSRNTQKAKDIDETAPVRIRVIDQG